MNNALQHPHLEDGQVFKPPSENTPGFKAHSAIMTDGLLIQDAFVLMHSQVELSGSTVSVHVKFRCQSTSLAVRKLTIISSLSSKQAFVKSTTKL